MRSRIRAFVRGSTIVLTLTIPAAAGRPSDAELLARMQQEAEKLEQQMPTIRAECQAGKRQACEQASQRQKQLALLEQLIEGCQRDERESCTQLRNLRRR
jgi:hypothetical protein